MCAGNVLERYSLRKTTDCVQWRCAIHLYPSRTAMTASSVISDSLTATRSRSSRRIDVAVQPRDISSDGNECVKAIVRQPVGFMAERLRISPMMVQHLLYTMV